LSSATRPLLNLSDDRRGRSADQPPLGICVRQDRLSIRSCAALGRALWRRYRWRCRKTPTAPDFGGQRGRVVVAHANSRPRRHRTPRSFCTRTERAYCCRSRDISLRRAQPVVDVFLRRCRRSSASAGGTTERDDRLQDSSRIAPRSCVIGCPQKIKQIPSFGDTRITWPPALAASVGGFSHREKTSGTRCRADECGPSGIGGSVPECGRVAMALGHPQRQRPDVIRSTPPALSPQPVGITHGRVATQATDHPHGPYRLVCHASISGRLCGRHSEEVGSFARDDRAPRAPAAGLSSDRRFSHREWSDFRVSAKDPRGW